ncbi:MAG: hypothetical protein R3349_08480, partial [Geminicoccaceae bacterium]|nr:hypothetical protein [Geminicoccaceae bacterium]
MLRTIGVILAWASLGAVASAEEVEVRVGEHPGFGRIVLEWAAPSGVQTEVDQRTLRLIFDRPLEALDLTPAVERLPDHLLGFAPGERMEEVVLQIGDGIRPNVWTSDSLTIIDLYRPVLDPPLVPVRISKQGAGARLVFDWPAPVSFKILQ